MYSPKHFVETRSDVLLRLISTYPLATLVHHALDGELTADHIPMHYEPTADEQGKLIGHVARANPLWKNATGRDVLVIFQGPQAYISPNWYATKADHGKVVPTWNYAVVHARGRLTVDESAEGVRRIIEKLTQTHEAASEHPWRVGDAPKEFTAQLLTAIVGIEIALTHIEGKWKVSQNRPASDRIGVAQGLRDRGQDASAALISTPDGAR